MKLTVNVAVSLKKETTTLGQVAVNLFFHLPEQVRNYRHDKL